MSSSLISSHQTNYLLDQLLPQLEQAFLKDAGFTERLYETRIALRGRL